MISAYTHTKLQIHPSTHKCSPSPSSHRHIIQNLRHFLRQISRINSLLITIRRKPSCTFIRITVEMSAIKVYTVFSRLLINKSWNDLAGYSLPLCGSSSFRSSRRSLHNYLQNTGSFSETSIYTGTSDLKISWHTESWNLSGALLSGYSENLHQRFGLKIIWSRSGFKRA